MNDIRNLTLAWACTTTCFAAAVETGALISVISSIILPVVFFALGKAIDLTARYYLTRRDRKRSVPPAVAGGASSHSE